MLFQGRAYYNLLCLERQRANYIKAEPWEYLDYRALSFDDLFASLREYNFFFDGETFEEIAAEVDAPEQLVQYLQIEDEGTERKVYLILFEIWRRLLDDRETVSIFCDELDYIISRFEEDEDDSTLLLILQQVVEILDSNVDYGSSPDKVFKRFCSYLAHDLENVIYTFIGSKIKKGEDGVFLNLLDHFIPYVSDKRQLQFLKVRALPKVFLEEKKKLLEYIVSSLQEDVNVTLSFGILFYLIGQRNKELFSELFSFLANHNNDEGVLVKLLDVLVAYHTEFGKEITKTKTFESVERALSSKEKKGLEKTKNLILSLLTNK